MTLRVCGDDLSSMELGSAYNCFTKQRRSSVFGDYPLTIREEAEEHVSSDCKQISDGENIKRALKFSSTGELLILNKKLAGLGYKPGYSNTHSSNEKWFVYSNTYIKKRKWIEKPPVPTEHCDDTHYLAEIHYGGYLFIVMSSTKIEDEARAHHYITSNVTFGKGIWNGQHSVSAGYSSGRKEESLHTKQAKESSHVGSLETDNGESIVKTFEDQSKERQVLVPIKLSFRRLKDHIDCFTAPERELEAISSYLELAMASLIATGGYDGCYVTMIENLQKKVTAFERDVYDGHSLTDVSSITTEYNDVREKLDKLALKAVEVDRFILPFDPVKSNGERGVLLLGRIGAGKSTFGNYLANKEAFKTREQSDSVTRRRQDANADIAIGDKTQPLKVIDVPGFFDPIKKNKLATKQIDKAREDSTQIHALLWVIKATWYEEANRQLQKFKDKLKIQGIEKYIIMVITHLNPGDSIKSLIEGRFKNPAEEVGKRVIAVRDFKKGLPDLETRRTREAIMTMVNNVAANTKPIRDPSACVIM